MCLNLKDYQFKINRYSYRSIYMNCMITTSQKTTIYIQKLERNINITLKKIIKSQGKRP